MSESRMRWRLAAILAVAGTVLVIIAVLIGTSSGNPAGLASGLSSADVPAQGAVRVQVGESGRGRRIPTGFLGLSIEFQAVRAYTGSDPRHVNPVL
ncbi:MAG: hypothetical protein ABI323_13050, partial [Solirubrobacteraceae bacterium]